jgi:hypothetical protein
MLHSRKTLIAKITDVAAGRADLTPDHRLEEYALLRGFARGELTPHVEYDETAALQRAIDYGLEMQALEAAPPAVRANPALLRFWLDRAGEARRARLRELEAQPFGANPPVVRPPDESIHMRMRDLENLALGYDGEAERYTDRAAEETDGRRDAKVAELWESGNFRRLGKLLDYFAPAERCKLLTADLAFDLQLTGRLARVTPTLDVKLRPNGPEDHNPVQPLRHIPNAAIVGEQVTLAWLCIVPEDAPPEALNRYGSWRHTSLASRPGHGCYRFTPDVAKLEAAE